MYRPAVFLEDVQLFPRLDHLAEGGTDPRKVGLAGFGQAYACVVRLNSRTPTRVSSCRMA